MDDGPAKYKIMSIWNTLTKAVTGSVNLLRPNDPPTKRIVWLSAGHSNMKSKDRGAIYKSYTDRYPGSQITEGDLTVGLRIRIMKFMTDAGFANQIRSDVDSNVTAETYKEWEKLVAPGDLMLDIHFNSAVTDKATGTEVITPDTPSKVEWALAKRLAQATHDTLQIPLRGSNAGAKTEKESNRGRLLMMRLRCEAILWEVCFPNNPDEQRKFLDNEDDLTAEVCGRILIPYLKGEI